jgi:hypothetical protein
MAMTPILRTAALAMLALAGGAPPALAQKYVPPEIEEYRLAHPEWFRPGAGQGRTARPAAIPDVYGPGAVLNVGNVVMKVTNNGVLGNPFPATSSDPSGQWPGTTGVEYLYFLGAAVAAVNPTATDPAAIRRCTYTTEWWPPSGDPEDRIYRAYEGIVGGNRYSNDDGDKNPNTGEPYIDEDFLDGRDNDGDGKIDEDYAAVGQQMYSCVMNDYSPAALAFVGVERHIPLGLELRQVAWAYSSPKYANFNPVEWTVINRSGHTLDSLYIGFRLDMDCGPITKSNYFNDDVDIPWAPSGDFTVSTFSPRLGNPERAQITSDGDTLCPFVHIRVNGFSVVDNDGDQGATPGVPSFLLLGHTIDPLGIKAPARVGFRAYRSFIGGTPYTSNGNPTIDQQRVEFMRSDQNINPETGLIDAEQGDQDGDYSAWAAVGPFLSLENGASIQATMAFAIQRGDRVTLDQYKQDYSEYKAGQKTLEQMFEKYPIVENAFKAQLTYEGKYDKTVPTGYETQVPGGKDSQSQPEGYHGCETSVRLPKNTPSTYMSESCSDRENPPKLVDDSHYTWFDFDCDPCTGVWDETDGGFFLRRWVAESPPPSPKLNVSGGYNYSDNPSRVVASGDNQITLAWDNLSEVTPDPDQKNFDFRWYKVWKVANWQRPVGSSGPNEEDWALVGEFRYFDHADSNVVYSPDSGRACPQVYIPNLSIKDLLLKKSVFATQADARAWVESHGYRADGVSEETSQWRFLQEAGECMPDNFHGKDLDALDTTPALDPGVYAEICLVRGARRQGVEVPICLYRGDLWDGQSGVVIRPDATVSCVADTAPVCAPCNCLSGFDLYSHPAKLVNRTYYSVGRYRLVDHEVKNGFLYFYSVTAKDSSCDYRKIPGGRPEDCEKEGRRAAVEADAVSPQASPGSGKAVWVVPNPYRGVRSIPDRSSAWDLVPNASDPTGTHIDFFGLPSGRWTIRIFTVAGDLVAELHESDPVNESIRSTATDAYGATHPGFNRQQDYSGDGQARWNLISRNGQDVVSGIYLFVVDSAAGQQRGKFVVIR